MSYILDALKKSEQDRGNGSIPNVQTIHSSALSYHQEKRPLWPWILIAVLVSNVFILIYFLKPDASTQNITASHSAATNNNEPPHQSIPVVEYNPVSAPVAIATPEITAPVMAEPISKQETSLPNSNVSTIETTAEQQPLVDIDELPTNIRQQIPDLVFSAHVYSTAPEQRSIVINDRFMEEGYSVSHDLVLVEITRDGAVFDFRGYRFSTSVLTGWGTH